MRGRRAPAVVSRLLLVGAVVIWGWTFVATGPFLLLGGLLVLLGVALAQERDLRHPPP